MPGYKLIRWNDKVVSPAIDNTTGSKPIYQDGFKGGGTWCNLYYNNDEVKILNYPV